MKTRILTIIILFGCLSGHCMTGEATSPNPSWEEGGSLNVMPDKGKRLRVGVALGGGGARGAAEVGVLKVIEEMGIPIDYIAGTSIGSIVGGLYAIGYDAQALDTIFRRQRWLSLIGGRNDKYSGDIFRQEGNTTYVFGFPINRGRKASDNEGAYGIGLSGDSITTMLDSLTRHYDGVRSFDDLPIPFRCVAVDIKTHKEVIMDSCELELAMRASMAIPGAFKPVRWKGHTLVDGGMLNNLPVDVVLAMGADVVIAIDLEQEDHKDRDFSLKEEFGIGGLLDWLVSRPDWKKANENRELADVYIRPNLLEFGVSSFSEESIGLMIKRGEEAAIKAKKDLKRLRDRIFAPNHIDK